VTFIKLLGAHRIKENRYQIINKSH